MESSFLRNLRSSATGRSCRLLFFLSLQIREEGGSCRVCLSPLDVHLNNMDEDTVVQPDLFILCDDAKIHEDGFVWGAPDFILEVLSPGIRKKDLNYKCWKYFDAGIPFDFQITREQP